MNHYYIGVYASKANFVISGIACYVKRYKILVQCFIILLLNPLTPMSDQDRISPYIINTISSKQVMRKKKNVN